MIVFPMVGKSSRFAKAGYSLPKFRLPAFGESLFRRIVEQFNSNNLQDTFMFILKDSDNFDRNFVLNECKKIGIPTERIIICQLDKMTRGQADTVAQGLVNCDVPRNERLIIFNIDTIRLNFDLPLEDQLADCSGYLEVFKAEGDHWSFAMPSDENQLEDTGFSDVASVAEKKRISQYCSNGLYYFRSIDLFLTAFEKDKKLTSHDNELYVAPLYNHLISSGERVAARLVAPSEMHFCGTPQEYEAFIDQKCPLNIEISFAHQRLRLLSVLESGRSQKKFNEFWDFLAENPELFKDKQNRNIVSTIFDFYSKSDAMAHYMFALGSLRKESKKHKDMIDKCIPLFEDLLLKSHTIENDRSKAMNLTCALFALRGKSAFTKRSREAIRFAFPAISFPQHAGFFRVMRNHFGPKLLLNEAIDLSYETPSIIYLFLLYFCTALMPIESSFETIEYIRRHISKAPEKSPGDDKRRIILQQILKNREIAARSHPTMSTGTISTRLNSSVGALLLSGQMRDDSFAKALYRNPTFKNHKLDVFVSTWKQRGGAPANFGSLRGYEERIRDLIRSVVLKHNISSQSFLKLYNYTASGVIDSRLIQKEYKPKSSRIDEEGVTTQRFESNQERLFYKLHDVFEQASGTDTYDFYIRMRPDLSFEYDHEEFSTAISECSTRPNLIYLRHAPFYDHHFPFFDDNFAIMGREAAKVYCGVWRAFKNETPTLPFEHGTGRINPHSTLGYSLLMANVEIRFLQSIKQWSYNSHGVITAKEYLDFMLTIESDRVNQVIVNDFINRLKKIVND